VGGGGSWSSSLILMRATCIIASSKLEDVQEERNDTSVIRLLMMAFSCIIFSVICYIDGYSHFTSIPYNITVVIITIISVVSSLVRLHLIRFLRRRHTCSCRGHILVGCGIAGVSCGSRVTI
jgi:hypothetical protein